MKGLLDLLGLTKIPVTVWVDDLGRMRKMTMTMDLSSLGKDGRARRFRAQDGDHAGDVRLRCSGVGRGAERRGEVEAGSSGTSFCLSGTCSGSGCRTTATTDIQSDLRNALTAEKVTYTDNMAYSDDLAALKQIEPSLDWGGRLKVVVGDSSVANHGVVCLSETSNGSTYSIADVASGPRAGTYYGTTPCRAKVSEARSPPSTRAGSCRVRSAPWNR